MLKTQLPPHLQRLLPQQIVEGGGAGGSYPAPSDGERIELLERLVVLLLTRVDELDARRNVGVIVVGGPGAGSGGVGGLPNPYPVSGAG